MLKPLLKKKAVPKTSKTKVKIKAKGTVCGACHYVRKDTDTNPAWQCPCCESAYSKVNVTAEEKAKLDNVRLEKYREKHKQSEATKQKKKLENTASGFFTGMAVLASGVGSTCSRMFVMHSPAAVAIGALIVIGSILYGMSK